MRQQPFRPRDSANRISQTYNDGLVEIYAVEDGAKPGYQPKLKLVPKGVLPFEVRRLGLTRIYQSKQAQSEIEKLIRVPKTPAFEIYGQDAAMIVSGSGLYRIESTQETTDVYPTSVDLGLVRITQHPEEVEV